ncbi:hypothetical protein [Nocardia brasiliensis]|uniref:hypothetical protein n=1 Tax=Nocardia brasiliensis TaxID=37326 RepID=UPI001895C63F|nr:hypothetical protein [Nocardia brasiliensis]MBF6124404.1 hypothetical protein [Nocardia brasiliensis]
MGTSRKTLTVTFYSTEEEFDELLQYLVDIIEKYSLPEKFDVRTVDGPALTSGLDKKWMALNPDTPPGPRTLRGFTIAETAEITDPEKADISVLADSVVEHIACIFSDSDDGSTDKVTYHQEITERAA